MHGCILTLIYYWQTQRVASMGDELVAPPFFLGRELDSSLSLHAAKDFCYIVRKQLAS